jgi:hypothetical protein
MAMQLPEARRHADAADQRLKLLEMRFAAASRSGIFFPDAAKHLRPSQHS